jgi:ADP-ribose pyrophosphatase
VEKFGSDDVEILERETLCQNYFRIDRYRVRHRTFAGGWLGPVEREVFERGHAVGVLLYDPDLDRVALIEQFRVGSLAAGRSPWSIEVVAGIVEEGETAEDVARREVTEEAGCTVGELVEIADFIISPGACSETIQMFCGRIDSRTVGGLHGLAEENEDIRVFTLATDEALAWMADGRIANAVGMVALLWLARERESLRQRWR